VTKVVESVVKVVTQLVKLARIPLIYPYIICSSFEHHALDCFKKIKVKKMFQIKPTTITTIVTKPSKLNNVLVNVVDVVMTRGQVLGP
jgi:hypothetical protein